MPARDPSADERFMAATLAYGRRGLGTTAPNPCVAALVVKNGLVLARGMTAPGGRPHAETLALAQAGAEAEGATLYVTLEPCSHYGHTAPCTEAIIAARIARVVIAAGDPDPRVSGRGVRQLREAGIEVVEGVCGAEGRRDHRGHIRRLVDGRPSLTLKLAETADGIAAAWPGAARLLITGAAANAWTHMARATHDAVMVGAGTARADDPMLTVRLPGMGHRHPVRIVLDPHATLPPASRLAATARQTPVLLLVAPDADRGRVEALRQAGVDILQAPTGRDGLHLRVALESLGSRGFTRVLCEGGPRLAGRLLDADLVDEVAILRAPTKAGSGVPALSADHLARLAAAFHPVENRPLGPDRLCRYEKDV